MKFIQGSQGTQTTQLNLDLYPPTNAPDTYHRTSRGNHLSRGHTLLDGAPYTPSTHTDVQATWRKHGWTPPSKTDKGGK